MVQLDSYSADETREKRHKPVKSNRTECIRLHWFQSFEFVGQLLFDNSRLCYLRYGHGRRRLRWFLFCCHIWPLLWIYHRNIPIPFSFLLFSSICLYINVWTRISNYAIVDSRYNARRFTLLCCCKNSMIRNRNKYLGHSFSSTRMFITWVELECYNPVICLPNTNEIADEWMWKKEKESKTVTNVDWLTLQMANNMLVAIATRTNSWR